MASNIKEILAPNATRVDVPASSKKRVLELLSEFISDQIEHSDSEEIYEKLLNREQLGSTGIGEGIAIPHCRLRHCNDTFGALIKLKQPIDYDSIDNQPIDIVFALLVPEEANDEHLKTLSMLASRFHQADFRKKLRLSASDEELYQAAVSFDD